MIVDITNRTDLIQSFCIQMTNWVTNEKDVLYFEKSTSKNVKNSCGDIVPLKPSINWLTKIHFSLKYGYRNASFDKHFLFSDIDPMRELWKSTIVKADDKLPVLIYKKTHIPTTYIFIPYDLYCQIIKEVINCNMIKLRYLDSMDAYVFELNEFLNKVKYKTLKKALNQL